MCQRLHIVIIGAHADDCELYVGGTMLRYLELGHRVTFVVMTDGGAGHHQLDRETIIERRYCEAMNVAEYLGIEYIILNHPDGWLEANIENRKELIRLLRRLKPDLVITHSINEYHPDHRNTARLVADTAYMVNVPLCVPDYEPIGKDVVYYTMSFKPIANHSLGVMVPIDDYVERKLKLVSFHESQVFEWLPWIEKTYMEPLPKNQRERMDFLTERYIPDWNKTYKNYLSLINDRVAVTFKYVEVFEASPWGWQLTAESAKKYFPFNDMIVF